MGHPADLAVDVVLFPPATGPHRCMRGPSSVVNFNVNSWLPDFTGFADRCIPVERSPKLQRTKPVSNHPNGTSDGQIRWAILGTGFIAGLQTQDLIENGFTVQAVGSRTVESSTAFGGKYGMASAHGSYEDWLRTRRWTSCTLPRRTRSTMRTPCWP